MTQQANKNFTLPKQPTNQIFTGVAGTGKTYHLQQIAKAYSENFATVTRADFLANLVQGLTWYKVICIVMLVLKEQGQELLKVSEIKEHEIFQAFNLYKNNNSLSGTTATELGLHSSLSSTTVKFKNRVSPALFDKDKTGAWYLIPNNPELPLELVEKAQEYLQYLKHLSSNHHQPMQKQRFRMVSFHQNYGYDEFIEGLRPCNNEQGQLTYRIEQGIFLQLCAEARQNPEHRYAILIDEINRANVVEVFGELMSIIEPDKREGQANAMCINLAYSKNRFSVPANVDIYATMNSQDHSLVQLDIAFRRRFQFIEMRPDSSTLPIKTLIDNTGETLDLTELMDSINARICHYLGANMQLGQAFFYQINTLTQLAQRFATQILPQLQNACLHQPQLLNDLLPSSQETWAFFTQQTLTLNHTPLNPTISTHLNHLQPQINPALLELVYNPQTEVLNNPFLTVKPYQQLLIKPH